MPAPISLTPTAARQFLRRATLLDRPAKSVTAALAHLGYVQVDPINVCGRMHDLILRNRVDGFVEGQLHAQLHSKIRPGFEHYIPLTGVLAAFPISAWPYLAPPIARRGLRRGPAYRRPLGARHERLARRILTEIAERGPLTSDELEHEGRSVSDWGTPGRLVKNLLELLLVHGRVLISARRGFRRVYDLPERVLPPAWLVAPRRSADEIARWAALLPVQQRRLTVLKKSELALLFDAVCPSLVAGCPPLYCLNEDLPLLEASPADHPTLELSAAHSSARDNPSEFPPAVLLAPLDPIIYHRRVTAALWHFDDTWEVYTPSPRRRRGYYALPVLAGTEIVGHVDPKADRKKRRLRIVSRSVRRGFPVAPATRALARFLGLR